MPPAGQLHAGIILGQPADDAFGHARAAAQQVDPLAGALQGGGQQGEEVGAVDVVANRLAQHVAGHPHADAVGEHQVRLLQGFQILGAAAGDVHAIGIHEADLRGAVAVEPIDDHVDRLLQRDVVDLDVEQLDPRQGRAGTVICFMSFRRPDLLGWPTSLVFSSGLPGVRWPSLRLAGFGDSCPEEKQRPCRVSGGLVRRRPHGRS